MHFPQGAGNFINGCVIVIFMAIFAQTGKMLDAIPSRNIIMLQARARARGAHCSAAASLALRALLLPSCTLTRHAPPPAQFAVAAAVSVFMTVWRWTKLKESAVSAQLAAWPQAATHAWPRCLHGHPEAVENQTLARLSHTNASSPPPPCRCGRRSARTRWTSRSTWSTSRRAGTANLPRLRLVPPRAGWRLLRLPWRSARLGARHQKHAT